jgi:hypothetical protein
VRRRGIQLALGLGVAAVAAVCAAPASAEQQITRDDTGTIAAYGGVQAWLHRGYNGRTFFRLVVRSNGVTSNAPIKLFRDNPEIDLGPGTTPGSVVAVYTRCTGGVFDQRCSVYELDVASGHERKVPGLFSRRASAGAATTWGGAYAFGRDPIGFGRTHGSKRFGLFAGTTHARRLGSHIPITTDMDASVVAYSAGGPEARGLSRSQIRLHRLAGRSDCLIDKRTEHLGRPRNDNTVTSPVLSGGYVYWILHGSLGTSPARVRRVPVPGPDCRHAPIEAAAVDLPPVPGALAVDGAKLYYANSRGVFEADLPAFAPV